MLGIRLRLNVVCPALALGLILGADSYGADQATSKKVRAPEQIAVGFCRAQSLIRLKYNKTVEWLDSAKEEKQGTWLVVGIRTAVAPSGDVDQQFTCRVQLTNDKAALRMIQIFKESSRTGKDIFEVR